MTRNTPALNLERLSTAWTAVSDFVFVPETEAEYEQLMTVLDFLIVQVGEDESHPLFSMMDVLSVLLEDYEAQMGMED